MCTLTWRLEADGFDLRFNRDELHTRAVETPPEFSRAVATRMLAPRDPDGGGTWLFVNEHGVACALLNDYSTSMPPKETRAVPEAWSSRGRLVLDCGASRSLEELADRLALRALHTKPFHLLGLSNDGAAQRDRARLWHWDGRSLATTEVAPRGILTSSSFQTQSVLASRRSEFDALLARTPTHELCATLSTWHRSHDPARPAHSVLMRRADAATRSITEIQVRDKRVHLDYEAVHPSPASRRSWEFPLR